MENELSLSVVISDPDSIWGNNLKSFLCEKLFNVDISDNGKTTQLFVYKNKYQVAVLDFDLKNHTSLEVLRYIKLNAPEIKVIFTVKSRQRLKEFDITDGELKRLGASDVLFKPLKPEDIFKSIEGEYKIESWKDVKNSNEVKEAEEVRARDDEFTRIKFENFFSGSTTIYDHYIRLSKNKFVKILHQGESFDSSRLKKFSLSNLEYLYFKTEDRATYINYTTQLLKKIIGTETGTIEKKVKYANSVVEKYLEQIYTSGIKPSLIEEGKGICENMFNLIQKEPELSNIFNSYEDYDPPAFAHLFLTSFFSTLTCKNIDWAGKRTIEVIALGALLHDIGKVKLPPTMRDKDLAKMSQKEIELYKTHPKLGVDILSKFSSIPEPVKQIVYQHHEYVNGEGFPNKLSGSKIYPLAKVVSLCDSFSSFLVREKLAPLPGIKEFLKDKSTLAKFDPLVMKALVTGFLKDK